MGPLTSVRLTGHSGRILSGSRSAAALGNWVATAAPGYRRGTVVLNSWDPHPVWGLHLRDGLPVKVELYSGAGTVKGLAILGDSNPPVLLVEEMTWA